MPHPPTRCRGRTDASRSRSLFHRTIPALDVDIVQHTGLEVVDDILSRAIPGQGLLGDIVDRETPVEPPHICLDVELAGEMLQVSDVEPKYDIALRVGRPRHNGQ